MDVFVGIGCFNPISPNSSVSLFPRVRPGDVSQGRFSLLKGFLGFGRRDTACHWSPKLKKQ